MASESSKRQQWQRRISKDTKGLKTDVQIVQCMANSTMEAIHLKVDCGSDLMSYMLMTAWQSVSQIPHLAYFHILQKWDRNSMSVTQLISTFYEWGVEAHAAMEFNGVQWGQSSLPWHFLRNQKASVQLQKLKKCPVASKQEFVDINVHSATTANKGSGRKMQKSMRPGCWGSHMVVPHDLHRSPLRPLRHNPNPCEVRIHSIRCKMWSAVILWCKMCLMSWLWQC